MTSGYQGFALRLIRLAKYVITPGVPCGCITPGLSWCSRGTEDTVSMQAMLDFNSALSGELRLFPAEFSHTPLLCVG